MARKTTYLTDGIGEPRGVPADAATVGFVNSDDWELEDGYWVRKDNSTEYRDYDCLHETLEESMPRNHKGDAHMLACPCPKCSPQC